MVCYFIPRLKNRQADDSNDVRYVGNNPISLGALTFQNVLPLQSLHHVFSDSRKFMACRKYYQRAHYAYTLPRCPPGLWNSSFLQLYTSQHKKQHLFANSLWPEHNCFDLLKLFRAPKTCTSSMQETVWAATKHYPHNVLVFVSWFEKSVM